MKKTKKKQKPRRIDPQMERSDEKKECIFQEHSKNVDIIIVGRSFKTETLKANEECLSNLSVYFKVIILSELTIIV